MTGQSNKYEGVVVSQDGKFLANALIVLENDQDSARTGPDGYFSFTRKEKKDLLVKVSKTGFRSANLYISYSMPEWQLTRVLLCRLCKYDSTTRICPACQRGDMVFDIIYGLPVPPLRKDAYYAGCEVTCCDPKFYCSRDDEKF